MTADLKAELLRCRAIGGSIGGLPDRLEHDHRVLTLRRGAITYQRVTLPWAEYLEAYCYWQELLRPSSSEVGKARRRVA